MKFLGAPGKTVGKIGSERVMRFDQPPFQVLIKRAPEGPLGRTLGEGGRFIILSGPKRARPRKRSSKPSFQAMLLLKLTEDGLGIPVGIYFAASKAKVLAAASDAALDLCNKTRRALAASRKVLNVKAPPRRKSSSYTLARSSK